MVRRKGRRVNGASTPKNLKPRGFKFTREPVCWFLFTRARMTAHSTINLLKGEKTLPGTLGNKVAVLQHSDSNTPLSWYDARKVALAVMKCQLPAWDSLEPEDLDCDFSKLWGAYDGSLVWVRWQGRDDGVDPWGKLMEILDAHNTSWRRI